MVSVEVKNITKSYEKVQALHETSFSVSKGELFGIIGPDGAGKTTLFRILTTLLKPDNGSATVEGFDVVKEYKQIRNIVGYMPGKFSLYQDLSVKENLEFFATIFGTTIEENYHLVKDIYSQIEPFKDRLAGKLSGGMKQKLALSCAMIHKPDVLFLDEPTTGVDAVSRKEFWEMLMRLKNVGITILVSTPYMDEASLCDRVALIQDGRILSIEKPDNIIKSFNKKLFSVKADNIYKLLKTLEKSSDLETVYPFGEFLHAIFNDGLNENEFAKQLISEGFQNVVVQKTEPTIEDCFMDLMRKKEEKNN
ncbi:MAG TPA: ABC transporter ATP-binding protein [Bacteroidales bacterium]|nr:ABC transporter ATP-binding protein [Bacteroidales bacterium]HPS15906.1 ABC transporter ATP-binding protein [Bacteroidales bacterium]